MARLTHFDPRTLLKQIAMPLLQQFFARRGELLDLPWDELREKKHICPIYAAWQRLPESRRRAAQAVLHDITTAATDQGIKVFAEEVNTHAPQRDWELRACRSHLNKALWFYLNFPDQFEQAALYARADLLATSRFAIRRDDLPRAPLRITPAMTTALAKALRDFYWPSQMRGNHCHIEHHARVGGGEYIFAYLDDWPDMRLAFEDDGRLETHSARFAFSLLFIYSPAAGSLDLVANGGHAIQYPLQRAFCQAVLGIDVAPADPTRPAYELQQVLDPSFSYPTVARDCVGRVRLSRIRLTPISTSDPVETYELKFKPAVTRPQWLEVIRNHLAGHGLRPTQVIVEQASFQLMFLRNGCGRSRSITFTVAPPSSCDLTHKSEEMREIGQRCLSMWGMINA